MFVNFLKWMGWIVALGALLVNFCTTNPPPAGEKAPQENPTEQQDLVNP